MQQLWSQVRQLRGRPGAVAALAAGVAVVWLLLAGIVGAIVVSDEGQVDLATGEADDTSFLDDLGSQDADASSTTTTAAPVDADGDGQPDPVTLDADGDGQPDPVPAGGQDPASTSGGAAPAPAPGDGDGGGDGGGSDGGGGAEPAPSGGNTTGVTDQAIKIGVHAPVTFSGVPLNLAEDPLKGLETYTEFLNQKGGINGRKIVLDIQDDRFDSEGARRAANALINDNKNFMVSGTLGIDQIAIVAAEAAKRGVPYTAAGGNEANPIPGMFQLAANYTTHVHQLADYMAIDPKYAGKRVGILVSDSEFIRPVAEQFKARLEAKGMPVSTIVANQKPAQNPDYNGYILQFTRSNTEVVVPLTDPLTTQQIVQRCAAGAACGWTYAFSNFAHDSDTALALMAPTWAQQRVRGLSSSCYYMAPQIGDRAKCANMAVARDQYIALRGQRDWEENGSGASLGYQIVGFIKGALAAPGRDLTRERFVASWRAYDRYSDLVTGPITFAGQPNPMVGATGMAVLEAQSNSKYKMISDGLLGGF